jgi:kinesin family protein 4/21/27
LVVILCEGQDSREADEVKKELQHTLLLNTMDKEMHELNKQLE